MSTDIERLAGKLADVTERARVVFAEHKFRGTRESAAAFVAQLSAADRRDLDDWLTRVDLALPRSEAGCIIASAIGYAEWQTEQLTAAVAKYARRGRDRREPVDDDGRTHYVNAIGECPCGEPVCPLSPASRGGAAPSRAGRPARGAGGAP